MGRYGDSTFAPLTTEFASQTRSRVRLPPPITGDKNE